MSERPVSCRTHLPSTLQFSLDGRIPVIMQPAISTQTHLLDPNVIITSQFALPIPLTNPAEKKLVSQNNQGYELDLWKNSRTLETLHYHLFVKAKPAGNMFNKLAEFIANENLYYALKDEIDSSNFYIQISSTNGLLAFLDEAIIYRIFGAQLHPEPESNQFARWGLKLRCDGSWEGDEPYQYRVKSQPDLTIIEYRGILFTPEFLTRLNKHKKSYKNKLFVVFGLEIPSLDEIYITDTIADLLDNGQLSESEIRRTINSYIRIETE